MSYTRISIAIALAVTWLAGEPASAVDGCKVKLNRSNGLIEVAAQNVSGPLSWGGEAGQAVNAFFNAGECIVGTSAKACLLADPTTAEAITPPASCTLHMSDGGEACSVYIAGCTPGLRKADLMTPYTQWGASSCTSVQSTELYSGWAYTNHSSHSGSASPLCLQKSAATGPAQGYVGDLLYATAIGGGAIHAGSIVDETRLQCARCAAASTSCFVHHGSHACPEGTDSEFTGYLYGAHYTHSAAPERICVDHLNYDSTVANNPSTGAYLYPTRVQGGPADVPLNNSVQCAVCCTR